jgi:hypothetical protein
MSGFIEPQRRLALPSPPDLNYQFNPVELQIQSTGRLAVSAP